MDFPWVFFVGLFDFVCLFIVCWQKHSMKTSFPQKHINCMDEGDLKTECVLVCVLLTEYMRMCLS